MEIVLALLVMLALTGSIFLLIKVFTTTPEEKRRNQEKAKIIAEEYVKKSDQRKGWIARDSELVSEDGYCPKCGSHEWKSAALMHMEGTSSISTSTVGIGAGVGGDAEVGGVGVGVGKTSGVQQTMLSKLAAPPERPISLKWAPPTFLVLAIAGLIFEWYFVSVIFGTLSLLSGFAYYLNPKKDEENKAKYQKALSNYSNKRVCQRCGVFYFFSADTEVAAVGD